MEITNEPMLTIRELCERIRSQKKAFYREKKRLRDLSSIEKIYEERFLFCIEDGYLDGVLKCIDLGIQSSPEKILEAIAISCSMEMFEHFAELINVDTSVTLVDAILRKKPTEKGNNMILHIMKSETFPLSNHINTYSKIVTNAIDTKNFEVIKFLIENGLSAYDVFAYSLKACDYEFVKNMIDNCPELKHVNGELLLRTSVEKHNMVLFYYLVQSGSDIRVDNDRLFVISIRCGNLPVLKYLISKGMYKNENSIFTHRGLINVTGNELVIDNYGIAARYGNLNILKFFIETYGKTSYDDCLIVSILCGHLETTKYLKSIGCKLENIMQYINLEWLNDFKTCVYILQNFSKIFPKDASRKAYAKLLVKTRQLVIMEVGKDDFFSETYYHKMLTGINHSIINANTISLLRDIDKKIALLYYLISQNVEIGPDEIRFAYKYGIIVKNFRNWVGIIDYQEMAREEIRRNDIMSEIKSKIYMASREIILKPGGIRMKFIENQFGVNDSNKSETYRYMD